MDMDNNNLDKALKDSMQLYIKLYSRQKGRKKSKLINIEAKKSWSSLPEAEKLKFYNKYKECQNKWTEKIVEYIDKVEPYMKEKEKSIHEEINEPVEKLDAIADAAPHNVEMKKRDNTKCGDNMPDENVTADINSQQLSDSIKSEQDENMTDDDDFYTNDWDPQPGHLLENQLLPPKPPLIKSSKELFELVKLTKGINDDVTWKSLSLIEKNRYNRAVLTLKKDYIKNYKLYLESLSPRDLFDHYQKTI